MSEIKFSLVLDDSQAKAKVQEFFSTFSKQKPADPLKGIDQSFSRTAEQAKKLGFEWDKASNSFKNDKGFSANLQQMQGNLKNVSAQAKASGVSFDTMAAKVKNSSSAQKLLLGSSQQVTNALKPLGTTAQNAGTQVKTLGSTAGTAGTQLKQLGSQSGQGLQKVGTDAQQASTGVDKLGTEAQQTSQQIKTLGTSGSGGLQKIGTDAQQASGGVDKLGNEAQQTSQQLKQIKPEGLKTVGTQATTTAGALGKANQAAGPLAGSLTKVASTGKPLTTVAGALDRGAQSAGKATGAVGPLATKLGQVAQKAGPLSAVPEQFKKMPAPIQAAGNAAQKTGQQLQKAGQQGKGFAGAITQGFQQILQGIPTGIGIAIANGITAPIKNLANVIPSAVKAFSDLDEVTRQVLSISGSSSEQFGRVAAAIREVGSQSAATNVEVGQIAVSLARAGFTLDEIEASLFAVAQGAEATGTSYDAMADIVVSTLGQFQLSAEQAGMAVDLLTQAANSSNQSVVDLGNALKYVGPIAFTVGQSLEETNVQLALLANGGIKASTAGTSLRTILTNLQIAASGAGEEFLKLSRGSARLQATLELIGGEMLDTNGELKTGTELIYALQDAMKSLTIGEQAIVSKALAGAEGLPALSTLINATGQDIEAMADKMNNSLGVAAEAQRKNLAGLSGSFKILESNISSALSAIGEFIAGFLKPMVDAITGVIAAFNGLPGPIKTAVIAITGIAAAIGVAKVAMAAFAVAAQSAFGAQVVGYITSFTSALKGASIAQVLNNAVTSAGALAAVLTSNLTKGLQLATKGLQAMTTALKGLNIENAKQAIINLAGSLPALGKGFKNLGQSFKNGFNPKQIQLDLFSTGQAAQVAGAAVQTGGKAAAAGGAKMAAAGVAAGGFKASLAAAGSAAGGFAVAAAPIAAILGGLALAWKGASDLQNSYGETSEKLSGTTKKLNEVLKGNAKTLDEAGTGQERWSDNAEKALGPLGTLLRKFTVFGMLMGPVADGLQWVADRFADLGRWANEWAKENAAVDAFNELKKSTAEADRQMQELRASMAGMTEGSKEYRDAQQQILDIQEAAADAVDGQITAIEKEIAILEEAGRGNSNYTKKLREQLAALKDEKKDRDAVVKGLKEEQADLNKLAGITGTQATSYKTLAKERDKAYRAIDNQIQQTEIQNMALVRQGLITETEARARAARAAVEAANKKLEKDEEVTNRARDLLEKGAIDQQEYQKIVDEVTEKIKEGLEDRMESEKALAEATKQAISERLDAYSREQQTIASNIQAINQTLGELGNIGTSAISAFKSLSDASTQYQITGIEKAKQAQLKAIDETYQDGVRKENAKRDVERRFEAERKKVLQQQQDFNEAAQRATYAAKQAELDLWYAQQTIQNQIAQVEAQVAIEKAKAAGASQAEIAALEKVKSLYEFQNGIVGEQYNLKQQLLGVENQAAQAQLAAQARANGVSTAYASAVTSSDQLIGKMNGFQTQVQGVVDKTKAFQSTLGEVGTTTATQVAEQVRTKISQGLQDIDVSAARQALLDLGVPPEVAVGMAQDISGAILEGSADGTIKGRAKIGELFQGLESEIPTALIEKELIDAMSSAATTSREEATEIFKGLPPRMPKEELAQVIADALGQGTERGQEVLDSIELSQDTTNKLLAAARDGLKEGGKKGGEALNDAVSESKDKLQKNVAEGVTAGLDQASKDFDDWADSNAKILNGAFTESAKGIRDAYIAEYNAVQVEADKALGTIGQNVNLDPLKGQVANALTTPIDEAAAALNKLTLPDNFGSAFEGVADNMREAKQVGLAQELKSSASEANKLKTASSSAKSSASSLASYWSRIAREALKAAQAAERAARARALGGPVQGGQTYQVNEVGREMFMSRGGGLSEIRAPRFGNWTAPSSGTVIPAHIAEQIREGKQNAATKVALAAAGGPGVTQVKVQQASSDSDGLQRSLVRELQKLNDGGQGPVNNQITIQSAKPVNDASRMLAEMSRLRTLRRY